AAGRLQPLAFRAPGIIERVPHGAGPVRRQAAHRRTEGWPATYCCHRDVVSTPPIVAPLLNLKRRPRSAARELRFWDTEGGPRAAISRVLLSGVEASPSEYEMTPGDTS